MGQVKPRNRNLFSDTYLADQFFADTRALEVASREAFSQILELRQAAKPDRFTSGQEDQLREEYLDKVLDVLGWFRSAEGRIPGNGQPDYALFATHEEKDAALSKVGELEFFEHVPALCEAKAWATDLLHGTRTGETPRGQIYRYIDDTHVAWGLLTNGREWMLIWRDYSRAQQRDYTIDLEALLSGGKWSPEFDYFFALFRRQAVTEGFLNRALEQSRLSGEVVGRSLKANIYEALRTLGDAIYRSTPEKFRTQAQLNELKANCMIFLYRLLFVNYAESRKLLPMKDSDIYRRSYSLLRVKEGIQKAVPRMSSDEYDAIPTDRSDYFRNIKKLFRAIDQGFPLAHIPQYNGGLFRGSEHPFLESIDIDDRTVARVVDLLSRTQADPGRFVDYSYLGIRELGSIYEGLLEYQFRLAEEPLVARPGSSRGTEIWVPVSAQPDTAVNESLGVVEAGSLYLATARGERKSTGSFYTPDEVVRYIVRQTLLPILRGRVAEAREKGDDPQLAILNTKVLDPAMGSGHFLVAATELIAEVLLESIQPSDRESEDTGEDDELEAWAKRQVVSHCIYGVDVNPMAVELAKVSLWLATFSRGHPLSFLDHRLKVGNSLFGCRLEELVAFPELSARRRPTHREAGPRIRTFDITGLVEEFRRPIAAIDAIDEQSPDDVERKKNLYLKFTSSGRYGRVLALADSLSAAYYGPPEDPNRAARIWDKLVGAAAELDDKGWIDLERESILLAGAQLASTRKPFHWDLEFPEVFARSPSGFDAVIGNPPYVRIYREQVSDADVAFFQRRFVSAHMKFDLYVLFLELGTSLLRKGGRLGFIVPDKLATSPYGEPARQLILRNRLVSVLDLRGLPVFPGVAVATLVIILEAGKSVGNQTVILRPRENLGELDSIRSGTSVSQDIFASFPKSQIRIDASFGSRSILEKLTRNSLPLNEAYYVNWGLRTGTKERTDRLISATPRGENPKPLIRGEDLRSRYVLERPPRYIDYNPRELYNPMFRELFEKPKIVFRKISGPEGLRAVLDYSGAYCFSTLICAVNLVELKGVKRVGVKPTTKAARRFADPAFVLAVCNSTLVSWWYRQTYSDKLGVNPGHVQAIPLPKEVMMLPPLGTSPNPSQVKEGEIRSLPLSTLEAIAAAAGRRLQELGDAAVKEAFGFRDWLTRELGPRISEALPSKVVERVRDLDDVNLIHLLEELHAEEPLRQDPQTRPVQEKILLEFNRTRATLRALSEEATSLSGVAEACVRRLFGLTAEESAIIDSESPTLQSQPRTPV